MISWAGGRIYHCGPVHGDAVAFRGRAGSSLAILSEVESETEFDDTSAWIVRIRKILVCSRGLAEAGRVDIERRRNTVSWNKQQEIRRVERVQRLRNSTSSPFANAVDTETLRTKVSK